MTKLNRYLSLIIICLTLSAATLAQDGPVEQALSAFDQRQQHATANAFFQLLDKEQFTESRLQFAPQVPLDSVRQQVWYWGAEWFYDPTSMSGLGAMPPRRCRSIAATVPTRPTA